MGWCREKAPLRRSKITQVQWPYPFTWDPRCSSSLDASPDALDGSNVPGRPAYQPDESVVDFEFIDILNFLQQYKASCPKLQMTCPWDGIPLPSIDAELESSLGLRTKIELSHELGARFIKYIRTSGGTAAKVPHWRGSKQIAGFTRFYDGNNVPMPSFRTWHDILHWGTVDSNSSSKAVYLDEDCTNWWVQLL
jgi:hypothetical protein